jgi:hypothetical protein
MCTIMSRLTLENNVDFGGREEELLKNSKKYSIKISMIKPYHCVDFWAKEPDVNNALEVFIDQLFSINPSEYFKIEVSES